ncbi:terpene synthase family protein [Nocardia wallacei]|uniref:terpene synthase family protein n=1 Tax=Nocardia wallacei TaxID=480035 RepID=UPI0024580D55|nr:terpene synthase family protein [Nocardia wallacei]
MVQRYTPEVEVGLAAMHEEYESLLRDGRRWSLRSLFSTSDGDIADYCRSFRPNRFGAQARAETERFCRRYDIWLEPGGDHYNSMTPYLHPNTITAERMTIIGIFNAILFWLNDRVGREKFGHLSALEQQQARDLVDRLCVLLDTQYAAEHLTPVEAATAELLTMLRKDADEAWFDRFLTATIDHLRPAIRDQNARARDGLLGVEDYIALRVHVSGMYPAIALCEFARDDYLPWDRLGAAGLAQQLHQLRLSTAELGALMNDMFSFEKECIADRADFNLIPIRLLNSPGATLADAIDRAAQIVRDRLGRFHRTRAALIRRCATLPDAALAESVVAHVDDLERCVQATWVWQHTTQRYKGLSIFTENLPS